MEFIREIQLQNVKGLDKWMGKSSTDLNFKLSEPEHCIHEIHWLNICDFKSVTQDFATVQSAVMQKEDFYG